MRAREFGHKVRDNAVVFWNDSDLLADISALPRCKTCGGRGWVIGDRALGKYDCSRCIDGWPREVVERLASSNLSLNEVLVVDVLAALREESF
jgi:hypothetical protein